VILFLKIIVEIKIIIIALAITAIATAIDK